MAGTPGDHLVQPLCPHKVTYRRLLRGTPNEVFVVFKDGDTTVCLGNLLQHSVTLTGKRNIFLMFKCNFLSFSLCLKPLDLLLCTTETSDSTFFTPHCHQVFTHNGKIPLSILLSRLNSLGPPSLSLCDDVPSPWLSLLPCARLALNKSISPLYWSVQYSTQNSRCFSPVLSEALRQGKFTFLNLLAILYLMQPWRL